MALNEVDSQENIGAVVSDQNLIVESGVLDRAGKVLRGIGVEGRAFVITDNNVGGLHGQRLETSLESAGYRPSVRMVRGTEESKSLATATELYLWLASERAERRDFIVALGGGVVGDVAGFVAATYLRGLKVIQIPTTLLSQVDSAIGGKTAVNLDQGKNLVGAWHVPHAILVDPLVLASLPSREIAAGWVETIKHALLLGGELLELVENHAEELCQLQQPITTEIVRRSGQFKVDIVAEDPREQGRRIVLNYGHTIGHALESASSYGQFLHGEAVAIGMTGAAHIGEALGSTPASLVNRQSALLARFGLRTSAPGANRERVRAAMRLDKKVDRQQVRWVLLQEPGIPIVRRDVSEEIISLVLDRLTTP